MSQPFEGAGSRRYADELRHDIDSGRTGDKIAHPDPAAAPLGTDDEAAGFPPSRYAVREAMAQEEGLGPAAAADAEGSSLTLEGGPAYALLGIIVAGVVLMLFFAISNLR